MATRRSPARRARSGGAGNEEARPPGSAKDRALGLLAVRWRSREELRRRLIRAGFDLEEIRAALEDLERAGLVEDERFARELVRDRAGRRLASHRAIRAALREKGVAPEVAERALEEAGDEGERALALATARAARLTRLDPQTAVRRLYGFLLRRGYGPGLARDAARQAARVVLGVEDENDSSQ